MSAPPRVPIEQRIIRFLGWTERVFFAVIALLLFAGATALLVHAAAHLAPMFAAGDIINETTSFLDLVLATLMVVELAYTVILSLRGAVLIAEPFLIVALIAVIRRVLVITAGHAGPGGGPVVASTQSLLELAVLTLVVLVFVASILALRSRPRDRSLDIFTQDE
jgi:phosphate-starvation-inducible protein E